MKAHERLALAIKEQRELLLALTRERDGGLDRQLSDLYQQIETLERRADNLEKRRENLHESIDNAQHRLNDLLGTRLVDSKPDLKRLVKMAAQLEKFKAECKAAGIDPSSLMGE